MKEIQLTRGKIALVDDEDYDRVVASGKWHACVRVRQRAERWCAQSRRGLLSRFILGVSADVQVDHKNGDALDNRRENLRPCTHAQNNMNQRKTRGSSKFKGVYWNKKLCKWAAMIRVDGRGQHLGLFVVEEEAAKAYDEMARHFFGDFARPNFPQEIA